jgi:hypothetical protein
LAVIRHWLHLMSATQSRYYSTDYGQLNGVQSLATRLASSPVAAAQILAGNGAPAGARQRLRFSYRFKAPEIANAPNQPLGQGLGVATVTGEIDLQVVDVAEMSRALSPADQANGITFDGSVTIDMINRWRADAQHRYSSYSNYGYDATVTLQNGRATVHDGDYLGHGTWVGGGFGPLGYPADIPISVACQLGAAGNYPDYRGSNGQPPSGC